MPLPSAANLPTTATTGPSQPSFQSTRGRLAVVASTTGLSAGHLGVLSGRGETLPPIGVPNLTVTASCESNTPVMLAAAAPRNHTNVLLGGLPVSRDLPTRQSRPLAWQHKYRVATASAVTTREQRRPCSDYTLFFSFSAAGGIGSDP